jgi:tetratricopeptide (TPR) repeat protein
MIQKIPKNPYIIGNPVSDATFFGRNDILWEVLQVLKHPQNNAIVLFGQRRIGKTSILCQLQAKLLKKGSCHPIIFFDLQYKVQWPLEKLLQNLAGKISEDLQQQEPDLGDLPEKTFKADWLPTLLNKLPPEKSLVLLFDEFDVLDDPESQQAGQAFFPYLSELLDIDRKRLNFVFVLGHNIDDMSNIASNFFKGAASSKRISLLNREDTFKLIRITENERDKTLLWEQDAQEEIWRLTQGHPYLTQHLCYRVWYNIYDNNPEKVPPTATLKQVVEEVEKGHILEASSNALQWLWNALPAAEQIVASVLAGGEGKSITKAQLPELLRQQGILAITSELRKAPTILTDWDLIELGKEGYCFRVELLRRWVTEYKPLTKLQEELDQVKSTAEYFYMQAEESYKKKQSKKAVEFLNKAFRITSDHLEANLLLADILLSQKRVKEARDKLEQLYHSQPQKVVGDKLIETLLLLAQKSRKEEQCQLYERVLELEPEHSEAKRQWPEIGQQLLIQFEAEENYDKALVLGEKLRKKYPNNRNWDEYLKRISYQNRLNKLYQDAERALKKKGNQENALTPLKELISLEPRYQQASRYLYLVVTGNDPKKRERIFVFSIFMAIMAAAASWLFLQNEIDTLNNELAKAQQQTSETRFVEEILSLEKGDFVVTIGIYGNEPLAQQEVDRITNDSPELKPKKYHNKKTGVWWVYIGDSYTKQSAEVLRVWATGVRGLEGVSVKKKE